MEFFGNAEGGHSSFSIAAANQFWLARSRGR